MAATGDHESGTGTVLAARAAALASARIDHGRSSASLHLVARVGTTTFAIPVHTAVGVLRNPSIARVPGAAPGIVGVTATAGNVVAVADVAVLLEVEREAREYPSVVLIADGAGVLGLLVDEVEALAELDVGEEADSEGSGDARTGRSLLLRPSGGMFLLDTEAVRHDQRLRPPHRDRIHEEPGAP